MTSKYTLSQAELDELENAHRQSSDKRLADRIKTVYLLGKGWPTSRVAEALLIDRETVRNHFKRYRKGGLKALEQPGAGGSLPRLNEEQRQALDQHLSEHFYLTAKEVAHFVKQSWGVTYSESGMAHFLHCLGYVYKKPKLIPGKADADKQQEFIKHYQQLKTQKAPEDLILFMDAVHPQHNPIAGYGWIKRGKDREIRSNTGRRRLNINGVIDSDNLKTIVRYDDTINAQSTLALFQQIETQYPEAGVIHIICDNARYYRSRLVNDYLKSSKIQLEFLPPYAPNLNLIERYWKFFKKKVLYGQYYETWDQFKSACETFFDSTDQFRDGLRSLLTDNFQIIGNA